MPSVARTRTVANAVGRFDSRHRGIGAFVALRAVASPRRFHQADRPVAPQPLQRIKKTEHGHTGGFFSFSNLKLDERGARTKVRGALHVMSFFFFFNDSLISTKSCTENKNLT